MNCGLALKKVHILFDTLTIPSAIYSFELYAVQTTGWGQIWHNIAYIMVSTNEERLPDFKHWFRLAGSTAAYQPETVL